MKTIAHISDLHFGTEDSKIADGLVKELQQLQPTVVVNSGDFTQRARKSQFRSAADYMKQLPKPQISIPGNHDIPLFDVFRRFISPLGRFKNYITDDMFPRYVDDNLTIMGINTARSLTWKSGRISTDQIDELQKILSGLPKNHFKIIVTHHPFIPPPGQENTGVTLVGRATKALKIIEQNNVDLLLAGHLHQGYTGDIRTFYPSSDRAIIVAQAGTAISRRVRYEPNGYNVIRWEYGRIEIEVRRWEAAESSFTQAGKCVFVQQEEQWTLQTEAAATGPVL